MPQKLSPRYLLGALLITIFVLESITMLFILNINPAGSIWFRTLVDAGLLTAASVPFLWWLFIVPLRNALNLAHTSAQAIIDTAADAIVTVDSKGILTHWNHATELMFGYTRAELVGKPLTILLPPDVAEQHDQYIQRYRDTGRRTVIGNRREFNARRRDGSLFPIELTVSETNVGPDVLFTSVIRDITERIVIEEHLHKTNQLLERIFSSKHALLAYMDAEFNFIRVNTAYAIADGRTPEEFIGLNHFALYPNAENEAIFRQVLASGEPYVAYERPFSYPEHPERGTTFWDWTLQPIATDEGVPAGLLLTITEATQRHNANVARIDAERNLRALIDANNESAMLIDCDGTILSINETAASRLHGSASELVGSNVYAHMEPAIATTRRQRLQQIITDKVPKSFEDIRDGRYLRYTLYPVIDDQGEVVRIAAYGVDVTAVTFQKGVDAIAHEFDQRIVLGNDIHKILDDTCQQIIELFGLTAAWVAKQSSEGFEIIAGAGLTTESDHAEREIRKTRAVAVECSQQFANTLAKKQSYHMRFDHEGGTMPCPLASRTAAKSALYIPLLTHDTSFGAFCLYGPRIDTFEDDSTDRHLQHIGQRISIALEMAADQRQLRLMSAALATAGDGIFITDAVGTITWANTAFTEQSGYSLNELIGNNPRLLKSGSQDNEYYATLWTTIGSGAVWSHETEERNKSGQIYTVHQTITPIFDADGTITHFVSIHKDISALKAHAERVAFMAHHDALTGLPNRALFYDRLTQAFSAARRGRHRVALLYLDLDRFKPVNDQYGHEAGDHLLQAVAQRLTSTVRESDTVSRLGGDEFAVILPQIDTPLGAESVAKKIIQSLTESFNILDHQINIGTSIGIAEFPKDADTPEELVKQADTAMYVAKSQRNTFVIAGNTGLR